MRIGTAALRRGATTSPPPVVRAFFFGDATTAEDVVGFAFLSVLAFFATGDFGVFDFAEVEAEGAAAEEEGFD
jgi:hypothetical protein